MQHGLVAGTLLECKHLCADVLVYVAALCWCNTAACINRSAVLQLGIDSQPVMFYIDAGHEREEQLHLHHLKAATYSTLN
jgi:hypothetical protein